MTFINDEGAKSVKRGAGLVWKVIISLVIVLILILLKIKFGSVREVATRKEKTTVHRVVTRPSPITEGYITLTRNGVWSPTNLYYQDWQSWGWRVVDGKAGDIVVRDHDNHAIIHTNRVGLSPSSDKLPNRPQWMAFDIKKPLVIYCFRR